VKKGDRVRVIKGAHRGTAGTVGYDVVGEWVHIAVGDPKPCHFCAGTGSRWDTVTVPESMVELAEPQLFEKDPA
jgi:hypothetical protein